MIKPTQLEVAEALASWRTGGISGEVADQAARIIKEQHLFMEFCSRWAWDKDGNGNGNGTSDRERLSCIKHHPTLTAFRAALEQSNEA